MRISKEDTYFFNEGKLYDAKRIFGSFLNKDKNGKIVSTRFTVYAPNASKVSVVGDFNNWDLNSNVMEKIDAMGIYSINIPLNLEWHRYKYALYANGETFYKADPYATYAELRPETSSIVYDIDGYQWSDEKYLKRKEKPYDKPISIYEIHLGSWRRKYGAFFKYNEIVDELIKHLLEQNFTHVELMPIYEHPLDDSWGYQGTGYYAATSRFGSPKDLMYLIDRLHQANIGVIIDWVPGHICKDAHGLYFFDGSPLYEYDLKWKRENEVWGTANLDLGKGPTRSFLYSNALFWMEYFHVDGFRIDAVSNLIYYLGDKKNGVNEKAISFLQQLATLLFKKDNNLLLMAEDSTNYPLVTKPVEMGGLGFNYKWNMGFMNDVLSYFKRDPIYRKWHHHELTFVFSYAYTENFLLPFSHDEVVHGKGTLLTRMPGDYWQKFANFRVLIGLWITHPGKKLLFMGQEFAHFSEWDNNRALDWHLFNYPAHESANLFVREMLALYKRETALYQKDHQNTGFKWIDANNVNQSLYSYLRYDNNDNFLVIILNMTPSVYDSFQLGVPKSGIYEEIINSDYQKFGGSNLYNGLPLQSKRGERHGFLNYLELIIAPLSVTILKLKK